MNVLPAAEVMLLCGCERAPEKSPPASFIM